eukprot:g5412.t1
MSEDKLSEATQMQTQMQTQTQPQTQKDALFVGTLLERGASCRLRGAPVSVIVLVLVAVSSGAAWIFGSAYAHGASPGNLLLNLRVYTALTYALTEAPFGMRAIFAPAVLFFLMNAFERRWGSAELVYFLLFVAGSSAVTLVVLSFACYVASANEQFLYGDGAAGTAGLSMSLLLAFAQEHPDAKVVGGTMRLKQVPVATAIVVLFAGFFQASLAPSGQLILSAFPFAFGYLRRYKPHPDGTRGDRSADFAFESMFPRQLKPIARVLAKTVLGVIVRIPPLRDFAVGPAIATPSGQSLAARRGGAPDPLADRRRARALQLLDQKLAQIRAEPVQPLGSPAAV